MSKKHHGGPAPVPPGNRPSGGPPHPEGEEQLPDLTQPASGSPFQEEDPKRRLGDFTGTGEHSIQQPGGKNDANH